MRTPFRFPKVPSVLALSFGASILAAAMGARPARAQTAKDAHVVPLESRDGEFWSRRAGLLRYRCVGMRLDAQSRLSPSVRFVVSKGPFNERDCKAAVASLEEKGCLCDESKLRCLETERIEPATFLCNGELKCLVFEGEKKGIVRVADVGDHITRAKCEAELREVEREPGPLKGATGTTGPTGPAGVRGPTDSPPKPEASPTSPASPASPLPPLKPI